ncbi:hypothetical protein DR864_28480 (plasmid) [Runella rosea]|uniref:Uncharacterized protein n=1 Tax=Runella rosea TaxID=2259595 RepID=A0A344TT41_9BACT|nr:hypothetical protein DR864_28480 [Runella rosea]
MKSYLYLILTTFLFLLSRGSFAQTKVISVDTVSGVPSETLPFDQAFVLKIPTKAARVTAIAFMPHVGRKTFKESLEHRDNDFVVTIQDYNRQ